MELGKARTNKEVDDLISVLRCGAGRNIDMEKLKFSKLIALADADDDGKHIEMLLVTLMHEHLRPIIDAGMLYIALSPLYKVSITGQAPQYLNTTDDLNQFYTDKLTEVYNFKDSESGKSVKSLNKLTKMVGTFMKYKSAVHKYAESICIDPSVFEIVFLNNYDGETGEIDCGERINVTDVSDTRINFTGFYVTDHNEHFVSCTVDAESFLENLDALQELLLETMEMDVYRKDTQLDEESQYTMIDDMLNGVKKIARVSRLKGLGEINADELWDTSLNPETRRLIQVQLTDDSEEVMLDFMGGQKTVNFRKEFLKEVFASTLDSENDVT